MSKTMRPWRAIIILCLSAAALGLGGCRESEQDRVLLFQKGKYLGKPDQSLPSETVDELRLRAQQQRSS